jgi:hypothetical protein
MWRLEDLLGNPCRPDFSASARRAEGGAGHSRVVGALARTCPQERCSQLRNLPFLIVTGFCSSSEALAC